ncbi:HTH-type transcriptional activator IlvY [Pseudobowmanella zhangzhouensis]
MQQMDSRNLQLFTQLATSLHFAKTAEAMHVTPSTLSRAIQRLEQDCGVSLFSRDNRNVRLTFEGEQLLTFARQYLQDWATLKAGFRDSQQKLHGHVHLFCSVTASFSHAPAILSALAQQFPQVDVKLTTGEPGQAVANVLHGNADLALAVVDEQFPAELDYRHLDTLPLGLIVPASMKVTQAEQLDWQQVSVIMAESGPSVPLANQWFRQHGIRPRIYAKVNGHEAIVSMVALGCGVGIVPKVVVEQSVAASRISYLPLSGIEPFKLGLCYMRERARDPVIAAIVSATL